MVTVLKSAFWRSEPN
jgi:hypothetical protein